MYAVLETGGKQYNVKVGDVIKIEKIEGEAGAAVKFDRILAAGDKIGAPVIKDAVVTAEILEQTRAAKIIVFKKKRRQNYRKKKGHKQQISVLRIKEIKA
jgi:large subunit ribosomal protein L21